MKRFTGRYFNSLGRRFGLPTALVRRGIKSARRMIHPLDCLQRRSLAGPIADGVPRQTGYRFYEAGRFASAEAALAECRAAYEAVEPWAEEQVGQHTYIRFFCRDGRAEPIAGTEELEECDFTSAPSVMRLALDPEVLALASAYLGEVPVLANVQLYASLPNDTGVGPQLYHWDKGDDAQMKFLFLVGDCGDDGGPFTFLPADSSAKVKRSLGAKSWGRMSDEEVFSVVERSSQVRFTGKFGDCLAIDSSACLHFGSRSPSRPRLLLELQYMARQMILEPAFAFSRVRHTVDREVLTPEQRLAGALIL